MPTLKGLTVFSGLLVAGTLACGPIEVDAPVNADTDIDNRRITNVNEIRTVKIIELEDEHKELVCESIEETHVTCEGNGQSVTYDYTRSHCAGDLDAVATDCGATVDDYLACAAMNACDRKHHDTCSALLACGEDLDIFIDIDIDVDTSTN